MMAPGAGRLEGKVSRWVTAALFAWVGIVAARTVLPDPLFLSAATPAAEAAFLILAALGIGWILLDLLRYRTGPGPERLLFAAAAGMGGSALLTFALGHAGMARKAVLWPVLSALALWGGFRTWRERPLREEILRLRAHRPPLLEAVLLGAAGTALAIYFLAALAPPTFFDSMVYHLALPERFARAGRVFADGDFAFSFFPLSMEMLYTQSRVLFADFRTPNLLNFASGLFLILAAGCLGARLGGRRAAAVAAAVIALTPAFGLLAAVPKHDLALALFETAAAIAWCRWWFDGERPALALAGILAGFACGTKYSGLYFLASLCIATGILALRRRDLRPRLAGIGLAAAVALAAWSPWWVRNLVRTGNPVYPVLQGAPPSGANLNPEANQMSIERGGRRDLAGLLRAPWDMTFHPTGFRLFSQIGPFLLALLLPLLLAYRFSPEMPLLLLTCGLSVPLWWVTRPNTRYLLGCLTILAAAAAAVLVRLRAQRPAWSALLGGFLLLIPPVNLAAYLSVEREMFDSIGFVLGAGGTEESYLTARLDYYPAARFANANLPGDARILLVGETRSFYLERPVRVGSAHDRSLPVRWAAESGDAPGLAGRLRREGITHLLWNRREGERLARGYAYFDFPDAASRTAFETVLREDTCPLFSASGVTLLVLSRCPGEGSMGVAPASRRDPGTGP